MSRLPDPPHPNAEIEVFAAQCALANSAARARKEKPPHGVRQFNPYDMVMSVGAADDRTALFAFESRTPEERKRWRSFAQRLDNLAQAMCERSRRASGGKAWEALTEHKRADWRADAVRYHYGLDDQIGDTK